jgi:hypothetical protein
MGLEIAMLALAMKICGFQQQITIENNNSRQQLATT